MKKITFYLMALFLLSYYVQAQTPVNDNCNSAISLSVNSNLSCALKTAGTLSEATNSNVVSVQGFTPHNDVWYVFTATAPVHKISLQNIQNQNSQLGIEVFSGACEQLNSVAFGIRNSIPVTGLTTGTTYYARVFSIDSPSSTTFEICISTPPPITNDSCSGATVLTVNPDLSCTSSTLGHLMGATNNGTDFAVNGDVWYSFTATAQTNKISLLYHETGEPRLEFELFSGNCNSLTMISSSTPNLIPGSIYYIRVFSYLEEPIAGTFDICIQTPPRPINDECVNAIALSVNPDQSCNLKTSGTVTGATHSNEESNITGILNDVWYTFTATASSHKISFLNLNGASTNDVNFEILRGNCGQLISISNSQSSGIISSLVIGDVYHIRVFTKPGHIAWSFTFDICIGIPLPPPANDECVNAISVPVNPDTSCTLKTSGTIANATNSGEGNNTTGADDDVWYKFVATATSHTISILDIDDDQSYLAHEVMQGMCGGQLESLNVSDRHSSKISGLTIGTIYYIRIFSSEEGVNYNTTFNVCVGLPPAPPANDNCQNAVNLAVNPNASCTQTTLGTIEGATDSLLGSNGIGIPDDDVWYKFTATSTSHKIKILNVEGEQRDLIFEIFEGSCSGQLTNINAIENYEYLISDLTIGNTYYIRVFSYGFNTAGTSSFEVCVTTERRPLNDNCSNATALTVNADLSCSSFATGTLANATYATNNPFERPDVWYSFVATAEYHEIKINIPEYNCQVYSFMGDCGSDAYPIETFSSREGAVLALGTVAGTTYFVRIFSYFGVPPDFEVCVGTLSAAPSNDNCTNALPLAVASSQEAGIYNATTVGATDFFHLPDPFCTSYNGGDVWFTTVIPPSGEITIQTGNSTSSPFDSGMAVYSGSCTGIFESLDCNDNISPTDVNSQIRLTNRIPGEEIYIRVWEIGNDEQKPFTISVWSNSLTTPEFKENRIKAYPNPVRDLLNLSDDVIITNIKVYNMLGQNMMSKEINDKNGTLDLSSLQAGPYWILINSAGITKNIRIIKQ